MTQNAKILSFVQQYGSITQLQAFTEIGCCRLSQRIIECERLGWTFKHEMVSVPARDGKTARVCRYTLIAEPNEAIAYG